MVFRSNFPRKLNQSSIDSLNLAVLLLILKACGLIEDIFPIFSFMTDFECN
jgi:hypothetical protein